MSYTPAVASALRRSLPRLLATVQREGLVRIDTVSTVAPDSGRPEGEYVGAFWQLTPFGLEALARLRKAGLPELAAGPASV